MTRTDLLTGQSDMTLHPSNKAKHPSPAHCIEWSRRGEAHTKTLPQMIHLEKQRAASFRSGHRLIHLALLCVQVAFSFYIFICMWYLVVCATRHASVIVMQSEVAHQHFSHAFS